MDLIRISNTKLKIMLTSTDMVHYDLHSDHISIADQHVRRVLRQLLADAKERTGFDADMSRLYVQMYPCADGGCELFISKPDTNELVDISNTLPLPAAPTSKGRAMRAAEKKGEDTYVYSFSDLEHLISVCKRLSFMGYDGRSTVYLNASRTYYLVLSDNFSHMLYSSDEYCFLGEYGDRQNMRSLHAYLDEYCTQICKDNAIENFMRL